MECNGIRNNELNDDNIHKNAIEQNPLKPETVFYFFISLPEWYGIVIFELIP